MNFSTIYLVTGISTLIIGLIMAVNEYDILSSLMIVVMMLLGSGIMLWFFERLIVANQKKIPSYEEILKIYNKMIKVDKHEEKRKKVKGGDG